MSYANVKKCINENWTVRMQKRVLCRIARIHKCGLLLQT